MSGIRLGNIKRLCEGVVPFGQGHVYAGVRLGYLDQQSGKPVHGGNIPDHSANNDQGQYQERDLPIFHAKNLLWLDVDVIPYSVSLLHVQEEVQYCNRRQYSRQCL